MTDSPGNDPLDKIFALLVLLIDASDSDIVFRPLDTAKGGISRGRGCR